MTDRQALDARLDDLWNHRAQLDEREWHELHRIIGTVLSGYHPSLLRSLNGDKAFYIHEFFTRKVFEPGLRAQPMPIHSGAIRKFFKNHLRDCLDSQERNPLYGAESLDADDDGDEPRRRPYEPRSCADVALGALEELGLSAARVRESAACWLRAQEPWVGLYLGLHHCPDAEFSQPLYQLAERHGVASYHHKARKLGLTHKKSDRQSAWFRGTLLGLWLEQDLRIPVELDNVAAIETALAFLCEEAIALAKSADGAR